MPLHQLLISERVFVTGHMVDQEYREYLRDTDHLNDLVLDHVSRVQGLGIPVVQNGHNYLRYRSILIRIGGTGTEILTYVDLQLPDDQTVEILERMPDDVEEHVTERAAANVFGIGRSPRARNPRTWLSNDIFVGRGTRDSFSSPEG